MLYSIVVVLMGLSLCYTATPRWQKWLSLLVAAQQGVDKAVQMRGAEIQILQ